MVWCLEELSITDIIFTIYPIVDPEKPVTSEADGDMLAKSASSVQSTGKTSQKGSVRPSISSMSSPMPQVQWVLSLELSLYDVKS